MAIRRGATKDPKHAFDVLSTVLERAAQEAIRRREHWTRPGWPARMVLDHKRDDLLDGLAGSDSLRASVRKRIPAPAQAVYDAKADDLEAAMLATPDPRAFLAYCLIHTDPAVAAAAAQLAKRPEVIPPPLPRPAMPTAPRPGTAKGLGGSDRSTAASPPPPLAEPLAGSVDENEEVEARTDRADPEVRDWKQRAVRAEAEAERLRSLIPSKRERARQRKRAAELERAAADREKAEKRAAELAAETGRLLVELAAVRSERDEALGERDIAYRSRRALEARLGDVTGRARYLSRILPKAIGEAEAEALSATASPRRRRLNAHRADLIALQAAIDKAFPEEPEQEGPDAVLAIQPARASSLDLRVSPLGGGTEIGGSALLIEIGGKRVLVDAGLRPNADTLLAMRPPRLEEALTGGIDLLVITHAHADHAGYVPAVLSRSPRTEVVCTSGTAALLPTMWEDSRRVLARRLETDAARLGGATGLYSEAEVGAAVERLRVRPVDRPWQFAGLDLLLFPAGHVLGAAGLALRAGDRRVIVSGDISDREQATVSGAHLPGGAWRGADLLVIESTYCHEDHRSRAAEVDDFVSAVGEVVAGGGRVLIPAFGLGRAQEVALILRDRLPGVPVLVDGMARDISRIYEVEARTHGRLLQIFGGEVRPVRNRVRAMEIEAFEEGVVITTSGMLAGGPALPWAAAILPDPDAALFLCGFQDEESPGRMLQNLTASGSVKKLVLGQGDEKFTVEVRARVETYHLSAHADRAGLIGIIDTLAPAETMLVHGYPRAQRQFTESLRVHGTRTAPTREWTPR